MDGVTMGVDLGVIMGEGGIITEVEWEWAEEWEWEEEWEWQEKWAT